MTIRVVGIAGITGQFAALLARNILKVASDVQIRGLCRSPMKTGEELRESPRVEIIHGEAYDTEALRTFCRGCDVVACCYQGDDRLMVDGQKLLIDACEQENVPRFVASDWSLDYNKLNFGDLFTKDPMKHVKAYLDSKQKVQGVHILNGIFFDTFFSGFFEMYFPETHTFEYWGEPDEWLEGTSYANSAEYSTAVILDEGAVGVQRFVGDRARMPQIAEYYQEIYGIKPHLKRLGSKSDLFKKMTALQKQYPDEPFKYMAMHYQHWTSNAQTYQWPDRHNGNYPHIQPVTWKQFMQSIPSENLSTCYLTPLQRAAN